ncbi:Retinol dehydrogenase, partial [Globisporangium polare]
MGIGRLMALKFAQLGAIVVVWDLNAQLGHEVVQEIEAQGGQAHFYEMDVTNRDKVYAVGKTIVDKFGAVDILINNAGIVGGTPILESNDAMIVKTFDVNVTSHFWTIKVFLPKMLARNSGHIVSIASAAGLFGSGGMVDYGASKFAAVGLMMSLRQELQAMGKDGVHLTLVCPSFIKTGMFEGVAPPRFTSWLTPEYVATQVVRAVRRNQWRLVMPSIVPLLEMLMHIMPDWFGQWVVSFSQLGHAMKSFKQTRPHA